MRLTKKLQATPQITESQYRNLRDRVSQSDIRMFLKSRKKFYKKCVLGERIEDEQTVATIVGSIADCIVTKQNIDDKFAVSVAEKPVGQVGDLCDELFKRALKGINEAGVQTESFEVLFSDAVQRVKYKGGTKEVAFVGKDVDKIVELFTKPDKNGNIGELYYKECLDNIGKTVVSMSLLETGERKAQELRESPYTAPVINQESEGDIEVFYQLIIQFEYKGLKMRAMLDKVLVDHKYMTVQPADVKCTYDNEGFEFQYLKGLYIQAATYDAALREWIKEHELTGYKILPMIYPVADTQNENCPLLYKLTPQDITRAYTGFSLGGSKKWYPGLDETIEDINFHLENGIWNCSREAHEKEGIIHFEFEYS